MEDIEPRVHDGDTFFSVIKPLFPQLDLEDIVDMLPGRGDNVQPVSNVQALIIALQVLAEDLPIPEIT